MIENINNYLSGAEPFLRSQLIHAAIASLFSGDLKDIINVAG